MRGEEEREKSCIEEATAAATAANYLIQSSSRSAELLMPREISKSVPSANAFIRMRESNLLFLQIVRICSYIQYE